MLNKIIYTFLLTIGSFIGLTAQVTIGSDIAPNKGALLDLKQDSEMEKNSTKGLGLPRVALVAPDQLEPCTVTNPANKSSHVGLTVYNMTDNSATIKTLKEGIYVWDGGSWQLTSLKDAQGYGPWYQIDNPTLPSRNDDTNSFLNAKAVIGGTDIINDASLSVHGNVEVGTTAQNANTKLNGQLRVSDTPILTGATPLVIGRDGQIGTTLAIQTKIAFLQSQAKTNITVPEYNSMNSGSAYVVPWGAGDAAINNDVATINIDNTITIKNEGIYEISGYSNWSFNHYESASSNKAYMILISVQTQKKGASNWVDFTSARYKIFPTPDVMTGQYLLTLTDYLPFPSAVVTLSEGDKIRVTLTNPMSSRSEFGWPTPSPTDLANISAATGGKFSRALKIQML